MDYGNITTEYLCYLMNRLGLEAEGPDGYLKLCETLHGIEFIPVTEMDENRCGECMELRTDYVNDSYDSGDQGPVMDILMRVHGFSGTMLELLTILAEKMAY